jgi:LEA14-like dessication related protein
MLASLGGRAMRTNARAGWSASLLTALALAACATLKPPTMRVEGLKVKKAGITGVGMEVRFQLRNPNPDDLVVERFEYELELNGHRLGRGYQPEGLTLRGFGEERVTSQFDVGLLNLPGAVKALLDEDRVKAKVKGHFYVLDKGGARKKLGFDSDAEVNLRRD